MTPADSSPLSPFTSPTPPASAAAGAVAGTTASTTASTPASTTASTITPFATPSVALYWDFENLHAALVEARSGAGAYATPDARFKVQEPLVDIQAIVGLAARHGALAINRAYCNWQYFGRYRDALLQGAVELIQLFPPGAAAKNGADIRLCLDALDDVTRFAHVTTVVVCGGDSDFMPLAQKLKAAGRTLVGVGARAHTNRHWAKSCHAFHYVDTLAADAVRTDDPDATVTLPGPIAGDPAN